MRIAQAPLGSESSERLRRTVGSRGAGRNPLRRRLSPAPDPPPSLPPPQFPPPDPGERRAAPQHPLGASDRTRSRPPPPARADPPMFLGTSERSLPPGGDESGGGERGWRGCGRRGKTAAVG